MSSICQGSSTTKVKAAVHRLHGQQVCTTLATYSKLATAARTRASEVVKAVVFQHPVQDQVLLLVCQGEQSHVLAPFRGLFVACCGVCLTCCGDLSAMSCSQLAAVMASLTGVPGNPLMRLAMPGVCARPNMLAGPLRWGEGFSTRPELGRLAIGDRYNKRDFAGLA